MEDRKELVNQRTFKRTVTTDNNKTTMEYYFVNPLKIIQVTKEKDLTTLAVEFNSKTLTPEYMVQASAFFSLHKDLKELGGVVPEDETLEGRKLARAKEKPVAKKKFSIFGKKRRKLAMN